jgi:hypothetical protein
MAREFEKRGRFFKVDDGKGIAYGWAIVCTEKGKQYVDTQGDHIPEDAMAAAAEEFSNNSRVAKDMHTGGQIGDVPFIYPVMKSSKDLGIDSARTGMLVGFKPSDPELLKLIASGERTGFSIGGTLLESDEEPIGKAIAKSKRAEKARVFRTFKINEISLVDQPAQEGATVGYVKRAVRVRKDDSDDDDDTEKCAKCSGYMKDGDATCPKCGATKRLAKGTWSTAMVDDFPDSSFLYVEPGGKKDADGKTTPRSLRHFPYRDENGKIDVDHLRDAIGRIPQSSLPATLRNKLQVKAEKLLAAQHEKRLRKAAPVLTSEDAGHQHVVDLDDAACSPADELRTATAIDADGNWHDHAWLFDPSSGDVTIAANAGHDHTVDAAVDVQTLAAAMVLAAQPDEPLGDDDSIPMPVTDEESSGKVSIEIAMRSKSTPQRPVPHGGHVTKELVSKEQTPMKVVVLTEREHAHYSKMVGADAEAFLAKSASERDAEVIKALDADPVVFKGDVTGIEVRKSQGAAFLALAKSHEDTAKANKTLAEAVSKANTDKDAEIMKARAKSEAGHIPGDDDVKIELLKWVGSDEKRTALVKSLDAMAKALGKPVGSSNGGDIGTPMAAFSAELGEFAKSKNQTPAAATAEFIRTPRGAELYTAYEHNRLHPQA